MINLTKCESEALVGVHELGGGVALSSLTRFVIICPLCNRHGDAVAVVAVVLEHRDVRLCGRSAMATCTGEGGRGADNPL